MTAVTTTASGIAFGAYDVAIAGGVEHMGHHPMGEGIDPNPRIVAEKIVDPSALVMGSTAENLHDRFPGITRERADEFALQSQQRVATAYAGGVIQESLVPIGRAVRRAGLGSGHRRRAAAAGHHPGRAVGAADPVPLPRPGHRRQRRRPQRRGHRLPAGGRGRRRTSWTCRWRCGWCRTASPASSPR